MDFEQLKKKTLSTISKTFDNVQCGIDKISGEATSQNNNVDNQVPNLSSVENTNKDNNEDIKYCRNCGSKVSASDKFCNECGAAQLLTDDSKPIDSSITNEAHEQNIRESEFAGKVIKCPNCGGILDSFTVKCQFCGFEIRDSRTISSISELQKEIQKIRSRKMPENKSFLNKTFNIDLGREERLRCFNAQKIEDEQKLIQYFLIPNTKEDLIEFAILASSNIQGQKKLLKNEMVCTNGLSYIWLMKLKQIYEKGKVLLNNDSSFSEFEGICLSKLNDFGIYK